MKMRYLFAIVVGIAVAASGCSSTSDDAADESSEPAVVAVISALNAKNNGDLDEWLSAHQGGKSAGTPIFAEEILMNANQRWEVVDSCDVTGETGAGDTIVECLIKDINDFWGVGGISDTRTQTFTVNKDGLISGRQNVFASGRRDSFNSAFHTWLSATYPDVYSDAGFPNSGSSNGPGFDTADPELMLVAVEYVREFVAQSDTYPLNPSDQ